MRRLDELAVVCPSRSAGGQRRYSRRHIAAAARVRELAGEGLTLAAARRVLALEDRISQLEASLAAAESESARLQTELARRGRAADRDGRPRPAPAPACGAQPGSSRWPTV